jgi:hypothetical protein
MTNQGITKELVASGALALPFHARDSLVYRLLNPLSLAAGQLAVFQGGSEVPISTISNETIVLIIVLIVLFGGGGGYWYSRRR